MGNLCSPVQGRLKKLSFCGSESSWCYKGETDVFLLKEGFRVACNHYVC